MTTAQALALIETEKRRDRLIRRVCIIAWSVTFGIVLAFAGLTIPAFIQMLRMSMTGGMPWIAVVGTAWPLIASILMLSVLVATLSTVGVFLRFRTASLAEIQMRLAALEEMLAARGAPNDKS